MDSSLFKPKGNNNVTENIKLSHVSRCSDSGYSQENMARGVMSLLACVTKHVALIFTILISLFLVTGEGSRLLPQFYFFCGTCLALTVMAEKRKSLMCRVSAVLVCYLYALLLRGVECTGTLNHTLQILMRRIGSASITMIRDVKLAALKTGLQCRAATTRSKSQAQDNWLPWSDGYSNENLREMQDKDVNIGPILRWFSSGSKPEGSIVASSSPETRHYLQCWDALMLKNGILMRKFQKQDGSGEYDQLLVPACLRKDVLFQMHNSLLSGHLGQKKTKEKLLQRYYWYQVRVGFEFRLSRGCLQGNSK